MHAITQAELDLFNTHFEIVTYDQYVKEYGQLSLYDVSEIPYDMDNIAITDTESQGYRVYDIQFKANDEIFIPNINPNETELSNAIREAIDYIKAGNTHQTDVKPLTENECVAFNTHFNVKRVFPVTIETPVERKIEEMMQTPYDVTDHTVFANTNGLAKSTLAQTPYAMYDSGIVLFVNKESNHALPYPIDTRFIATDQMVRAVRRALTTLN